MVIFLIGFTLFLLVYYATKSVKIEVDEEVKTKLEEALKEKDRFIAHISHELKTPLVSILGYSSLVDCGKDELVEHMAIIKRNAELQLSMIDELLDLSKISAHQFYLEKSKIDIKSVINNSIKSFKLEAEKKNVEIIVRGSNPVVIIDPVRFEQVLNNLFANSLRFTSNGFIKILVMECGDEVLVKFEDSGSGIPKDKLEQVFSAFSYPSVGLGLGLSIVKSIVELHGGTVSLQSKVGVGTVVNIVLPRDYSFFKGLKILLVEDNTDTSNLIKYFLELQGAIVHCEYDSVGVYKLKDKFDLYIFDIALPTESGTSLLKRLRKGGDNTPAVAISAFPYYLVDSDYNGFAEFFPKPLKFEDLLKIQKIIEK